MGSLFGTLAQHSLFNMKFLVLATCITSSTALYLVAYPNGAVVPADTHEVQAAKTAHLQAHVLPLAHTYVLANTAVVPIDQPAVLSVKDLHVAAGRVIHQIGTPGFTLAGLGYAPYPGLVANLNSAFVPVGTP